MNGFEYNEDSTLILVYDHFLTVPYCGRCGKFVSRYDIAWFCIACQKLFCQDKVCSNWYDTKHGNHGGHTWEMLA